jgi:hypothetical protein
MMMESMTLAEYLRVAASFQHAVFNALALL